MLNYKIQEDSIIFILKEEEEEEEEGGLNTEWRTNKFVRKKKRFAICNLQFCIIIIYTNKYEWII